MGNTLSGLGGLLVGPAVAGVVTARWGVGACYLLDALTFGAALYAVLRLPSMRPLGEVARPGIRAIWAGWRFTTSDRPPRAHPTTRRRRYEIFGSKHATVGDEGG